jgi:hypothetical protein
MDDLSDEEAGVVLCVMEMVRDDENLWRQVPIEDRPHFMSALEKLTRWV